MVTETVEDAQQQVKRERKKDKKVSRKKNRESFGERFRKRLAQTDFNSVANRRLKPILVPAFIERTKPQSLTRIGQWSAAVVLPFIIMVSLILVETIALTVTDIALNGEALDNFLGIVGFLVTLFNLSMFCLFAFAWFHWVRTGGFGLLAF